MSGFMCLFNTYEFVDCITCLSVGVKANHGKVVTRNVFEVPSMKNVNFTVKQALENMYNTTLWWLLLAKPKPLSPVKNAARMDIRFGIGLLNI
jgi:hypothetical protein